MFATFFSHKILKLHTALKSSFSISSLHIPLKNTPTILSALSLVFEDAEDEVSNHLSVI